MRKPRIAILASGSGTTAESFIKSCIAGKIPGIVIAVISNNKRAGVFEKVKILNQKHGLNIKRVHIGKSNFPPNNNEETGQGQQTSTEEKAVLNKLSELEIDLVVLLGYMKRVGRSIVKKYGWQKKYDSIYQARMLNTHPGPLPDTKGLYGILVQQFVLNNQKAAGHCLIAVSGEYDDGPVVSEHLVPVKPGDTPESLFERVKESEKAHLAADFKKFIAGQGKFNRENK